MEEFGRKQPHILPHAVVDAQVALYIALSAQMTRHLHEPLQELIVERVRQYWVGRFHRKCISDY